MPNQARALGMAIALAAMGLVVLVGVVPNAAADSWTWTTDGDWNAAGSTFMGTEVVGTGIPAKVELLKDVTDWANKNPPSPPGNREGPGFAFSEQDGVGVSFGGYDGTYLDDTWEYNLTTNAWTQVVTSPRPAPRESPGMSYDAQEKVIVLYGGWSDVGYFTDTWEYNAATNTWVETTPTPSPPELADTPLAYDALADRHILAGQDIAAGLFETWAYDATANLWLNRSPGSSPPTRSGHALAYHSARQAVVLFGGAQILTIYGDTWEYSYSGNFWALTVPDGSGPTARAAHAMTYRTQSNSVLTFGGTDGSGLLADTWQYSASAVWTMLITPTSPPGRRLFGLTFDAANDAAILYAGAGSGGSFLGDTWALGAGYRGSGRYAPAYFDSGGASVEWGEFWWNKTLAGQPANTFLRFQIASSDVPNPPSWDYRGPDGSLGTYYTTEGTAVWSGLDNRRYLRFLADFGSFDTQATPSMEDVTITYVVIPQPPYIVGEDPLCPSFDVARDKVPRIVFSERMNTATVTVTSSPPMTFQHQWSNNDATLDLLHTQLFAENQLYQLFISGKDMSGFDLIETSDPDVCDGTVAEPWIFVTLGVNPYMTNTNPSQGQSNVALAAPIVITFSEPMDTSSLQWTVDPKPPNSYTPLWSGGDSVLTLSHTELFQQCTQYTVEVTAGRDKAGLTLVPGPVQNPWTFVSACINPYLTQTSPAHLAGDVALNANVVVDFNEAMLPASLNQAIFISPDVGGKSFSWSNGNRRLTMAHSSPFAGCGVYTVTVEATDVDGNPLIPGPPTAAPNPFLFIALCNNPYIAFHQPLDQEQNVSQTVEIAIFFSEAMNTASVQYTISAVQPPGPGPMVTGETWNPPENSVLTIQTTSFSQCTRYQVYVTQGQNAAGMPLVPGPAPNPWTFDIICTYPYVTTTNPTDGATLVPVTQPIWVNFSEPMDTGSMVWTTTPPSTLTGVWSNGDRTLRLNHGVPFADCTLYDVFVDGNDLDGNPLLTGAGAPAAPDPWSFTTRCAGFYVARTDPANQTTGVPLNKDIVVEFSEAANPASFTLTLVPGAGSLSPVWSAGNTIATVTHSNPFTECDWYTATVTATNATGGPLTSPAGSAPNPWRFRATCVAPQILSTSPVDGDVSVLPTAPIIANFSEPMSKPSVTWSILPAIALTGTWSNGDQTLTLTHTQPFQTGVQYCVTIAGQDLDGNPLVPGPVPNPWCFTTSSGPAAPRGLQVVRSPPSNIMLVWQGVAQASSYVIYSATNKFAAWPWPQIAEVPSTQTSYTHSGAGSDGLPHYYVVRTKDLAGSLSGNSTMGAKVPLSFVFSTTRSNVHWISLPYRTMYTTAKSISDELSPSSCSVIDIVARWDPVTQRPILWYCFRNTWRGTNFALAPGDGLYLGVRSSFTWVVNGTDGSVPLTFAPLTFPSLSWISLPYTSRYAKASDIVVEIEGGTGPTAHTVIEEVAKWDAATQTLVRYYWTSTGWQGTDFTIAAGEGIRLKVVAAFVWTPALLTPEVP